jgi:hypothetical protein
MVDSSNYTGLRSSAPKPFGNRGILRNPNIITWFVGDSFDGLLVQLSCILYNLRPGSLGFSGLRLSAPTSVGIGHVPSVPSGGWIDGGFVKIHRFAFERPQTFWELSYFEDPCL